MEKLNVKLENCYGIGNFDHEFDFSKSNVNLIYAPNGSMKTSFANTFDCIAKNDKKILPTDRIYKDRKTIYNISVDGKQIPYESIFVIHAEEKEFDATNKISSFLASKELKKEYDTIFSELDKSKGDFIKRLKDISKSSDCEAEFISTFGKESFYLNIISIEEKLDETYTKYEFRYNDIFDKKGNIKKFIDSNKSLIHSYFDNYTSLLEKSTFFRKSDKVSFGTGQANELINSIKDDAFFEAKHKMVLNDGKEIRETKELKEIVEHEISQILNDVSLREAFDKIDKAIGSNIELRTFKQAIEKDNTLVLKLQDYEAFKQEVWYGYLVQLKSDVKILIDLFKTKKDRLEEIISLAKKETETWKNIIDIFNSRFYVPFTVKLKNQEDIILKQEVANLEFEYKDISNELPIIQNKENLLNILSRGELKAYYILQIIFDIEARKNNDFTTLLIIDDIADSFDYKNKYAIIEYIKDFKDDDKFRAIILTHNFDFYRTIASRLRLDYDITFMAIRKDDRSVELNKGEYTKDVFSYFLKNVNKEKIFISMIPFVRNIIEYMEGTNADDYLKLTGCMHIKRIKTDTSKILTHDIFDLFKSRFVKISGKFPNFDSINIMDFIFSIADAISNEKDIDEVLLENKIILSIAIRLRAEEFMIKALGDKFDESSITRDQTRVLFDLYKSNNPSEINNIILLDKVNLMTPENIHVNAFMFEPLVDMSVNHLIYLYKQIRALS